MNESTKDREIRTTAVDFSFGELLNLHRDEEIVIRPEYQRLFRWSIEQRSRLIESILLGLPIPPIFLIENDDGILELIDGLQRTSSVLQFLDHNSIGEQELTLSGCDILDRLNGETYFTLSTTEKLRVKRTPIRAIIINKSGDSFVKYEMFKRLNTGGALLSAQEIRNCSSRMVEGGDEFYEAIQDMAADDNFKMTIGRLPENYREKRADEELVIRFFAVTTFRDEYKGNIEEWLDTFMERVLFKEFNFDIENSKNKFAQVFALINNKLSDEAFTRFNDRGKATGRLAPAYYEAVVTTFFEEYETLQSKSSVEIRQRLQDAFSSDDFKEATGPGANTTPKLEKRIATVKKILVENNVDF